MESNTSARKRGTAECAMQELELHSFQNLCIVLCPLMIFVFVSGGGGGGGGVINRVVIPLLLKVLKSCQLFKIEYI